MKFEAQAIRPNEDESLIIELAKTAYKFFEKHPNEYAADIYVKGEDGIVGHVGQIVNPKYVTLMDGAALTMSTYKNRNLIRTVQINNK